MLLSMAWQLQEEELDLLPKPKKQKVAPEKESKGKGVDDDTDEEAQDMIEEFVLSDDAQEDSSDVDAITAGTTPELPPTSHRQHSRHEGHKRSKGHSRNAKRSRNSTDSGVMQQAKHSKKTRSKPRKQGGGAARRQ
jgi:hypothetical protein